MSEITGQKRKSYTGLRRDVISLIGDKPTNVLDVGCSNGTLLQCAKEQLGANYTVGIEVDHALAEEADAKVDKVLKMDLDSFCVAELGGQKFDLIILADVLEHTKEPSRILAEIRKAAKDDAEIIISLPNVQHWTAIKNLLIGRWPRHERGLFDKTHLRFFTWQSIVELAEDSGLRIERRRRNLRIVDSPESVINHLSRAFGWWPVAPFFTYQYVVKLRLIGNSDLAGERR